MAENVLMEQGPVRPQRTLTVFGLAMITTGIITSIHGAPSMAEYGLGLVTIYVIVALVFLLPSALISAELATGWPEDGGVYVWVREAFGEGLGFVAVWAQWAENVVWFPSILQVTVVTAVYGFAPQLQDNKWFTFLAVNTVFWSLTVANLYGMRTSGAIATFCTLAGRILPILFIALLAVVFLVQGNPSQVALTWDGLFPDFSDFGLLSFIVGAFLTFAGIEASASNAASARNPRRDYPVAILWSAGVALILVTLIALAIAVVVPQHQISLVSGIMEAIHHMLATLHMAWLVPIVGLLIAAGMMGEVNNWIPAPTRGLLVAGRDGILPPFWQRENRYAVHTPILIFQGAVVTGTSSLILFFDIQEAFWLLNVVPTMLYLIMYFLMFAAGVRLRYTHPEVPRRYRVPAGNAGMWFLFILGTLGGLLGMTFAFIPPETVQGQDRATYIAIVSLGFLFFTLIPLLIFYFRRSEWKPAPQELEMIIEIRDSGE